MPKGNGVSKQEEALLAKKAAEAAAKLVDIRSQIKGFDTKAWLIDTVKYISWVVVFTLSIFANRGTANQYNYVDLWRAQVSSGIPDPFATGDHFWQMMSDSVVKMLGPAALVETNDSGESTGFYSYPSNEGDYGLAYKSPLNSNETITRLAWNGNIIVDGIWLRQLRISSINCSKFGNIAQVLALPFCRTSFHCFHRNQCPVSRRGTLMKKKNSTPNCLPYPLVIAAMPTPTKPTAASTSISPRSKQISRRIAEASIGITAAALSRG
jgi:hypothetical protein